jgi:hypothetical protein
LVGLSGSLIKDTLKESPLENVLGLTPEPIDEPEATTVLVGELPYSTFCDHMWTYPLPFRCLLHPVCPNIVSPTELRTSRYTQKTTNTLRCAALPPNSLLKRK